MPATAYRNTSSTSNQKSPVSCHWSSRMIVSGWYSTPTNTMITPRKYPVILSPRAVLSLWLSCSLIRYGVRKSCASFASTRTTTPRAT